MVDPNDLILAAQAAANAALREANNREEEIRLGGQHDSAEQSLFNPDVDVDRGMNVSSLNHNLNPGLFAQITNDESASRLLQEMFAQQQELERKLHQQQQLVQQQKIPHQPSQLEIQQRAMEQRQKQQLEQKLKREREERKKQQQRHFMTVARNGKRKNLQELWHLSFSNYVSGVILESTVTITGTLPENLLMTSLFESVHEDDLPGFMCVKTQFWDKGQGTVPAFVRRRHVNTGKYIWIESKAIQYIEQPVAGYVVQEVTVVREEEAMAKEISRQARVSAILIVAVEASMVRQAGTAHSLSFSTQNEAGSGLSDHNEAEAYRGLVDKIPCSGNGFGGKEKLRDLVEIASGTTSKSNNVSETEEPKDQTAACSMLDQIRQGVRLDFGLCVLTADDVRLITLVLSGKVPIDQVSGMVLAALQSGSGLEFILGEIALESEQPDVPHSMSVAPPPLAVINLSYTFIGNSGIEVFSEILFQEDSQLQTLDVSFCGLDEKGFLALAKAITKRKKRNIASLKGLIVSGNHLSGRAAADLGASLSLPNLSRHRKRARNVPPGRVQSGYDSEDSDEDEEDEDEEDEIFGLSGRKRGSPALGTRQILPAAMATGIQVLHVANASMTAETTARLLAGLGTRCAVRELNLSSNYFGPAGAGALVQFLESGRSGLLSMPKLDRLDMSNNKLGDNGATQLARVISKRSSVHFVDLRLSCNSVGSGGIETIMNKLLQHNLLSLSLNKNNIGDHGCQLVAASIQSMKSLSRLDLGFNQIGCRGINTLMRSLVGCESLTYLGLSGNILLISGAISLAFALSQHPRLEALDLDNCCLGQSAQCHVVAGAISNRLVPMKRLTGFAAGPPLVAIGALEPYAQTISNEECFRIRKNEQMKNLLQWRERNRLAKQNGEVDEQAFSMSAEFASEQRFLGPDFVANMNSVNGSPSQNSYFRVLGWLGHIPFDEDELTSLQNYFYDADGGEGDRGNDGYVNLKLRGDLLAALDSEVADEIREDFPALAKALKFSVGLDLDKLIQRDWDSWLAFKGHLLDKEIQERDDVDSDFDMSMKGSDSEMEGPVESISPPLKVSKSGGRNKSLTGSTTGQKSKQKLKPRITKFPGFERQLEELKFAATDMIKNEEDDMQHEVILSQYAEASLAILRQLRYFCMQIGLDGWRQVGEHPHKRKILVVDDSRVTRKLVSRAFEKANFIVDTAANGSEGVEKMKESIYDIAFMDIDMPVMNGFDATKKLREWEDSMRPGVRQPICALTATYVDDFSKTELMKFKEAGLDVMERKPCNIPRLLKVVDDVSPMFSDLSVNILQREQSDSSLSCNSQNVGQKNR